VRELGLGISFRFHVTILRAIQTVEIAPEFQISGFHTQFYASKHSVTDLACKNAELNYVYSTSTNPKYARLN
jgi:hypothetical protein